MQNARRKEIILIDSRFVQLFFKQEKAIKSLDKDEKQVKLKPMNRKKTFGLLMAAFLVGGCVSLERRHAE